MGKTVRKGAPVPASLQGKHHKPAPSSGGSGSRASKRQDPSKLGSNADRYEESDSDETVGHLASDTSLLLQTSVAASSHFEFRDEQQWDKLFGSGNSTTDISLSDLAAGLKMIPFAVRLNLEDAFIQAIYPASPCKPSPVSPSQPSLLSRPAHSTPAAVSSTEDLPGPQHPQTAGGCVSGGPTTRQASAVHDALSTEEEALLFGGGGRAELPCSIGEGAPKEKASPSVLPPVAPAQTVSTNEKPSPAPVVATSTPGASAAVGDDDDDDVLEQLLSM